MRLARERFRVRLFVNGPPGFGVRLARSAAERSIPVSFFGRELEKCREGTWRGCRIASGVQEGNKAVSITKPPREPNYPWPNSCRGLNFCVS